MIDILMAVAPETSIVVAMANVIDGSRVAAMRPYFTEAAAAHGVAFEEVFVGSVDEVGPAVDAIAARPGTASCSR